MKRTLFRILLLIVMLTSLSSAVAWAQRDVPITNWLQDPASTIALDVRHNFWTTALLTLPFLLLPQVLLIFIIWKFRESRGHAAATFHDNVKLEVVWTIIPVLTLIAIAIPTYGTLRKMDVPPKSDLVIEIIGHQFFWEYRYPKFGVAIANEPLVVPADRVVTANATSVDVVHSWWVPAFGVKQDANPGRITHTWFKAREGRYKGQCAELCGSLHAEMFIDVTVLPPDEFDRWILERRPQQAPVDTTANPPALTAPDVQEEKAAQDTAVSKEATQ